MQIRADVRICQAGTQQQRRGMDRARRDDDCFRPNDHFMGLTVGILDT